MWAANTNKRHALITIRISPCGKLLRKMLVFIDESGDPGRKTTQGSSRFFVLAVVMFDDHEEAARCERAIERFADRLGRGSQEFKFSKDSHRTRLAFLEAVRPFRCAFHAVVFDKAEPRPRDEDVTGSFYAWACETALESASTGWFRANVVLDAMGDRRFQQRLHRRLRQQVRALRGPAAITRLRSNRSQSSRLLQLADYVAGVVHRRHGEKKWSSEYFALLEDRGSVTSRGGP